MERPGCDDKGICIVEDDPDPSMSCEDYESSSDDYENE